MVTFVEDLTPIVKLNFKLQCKCLVNMIIMMHMYFFEKQCELQEEVQTKQQDKKTKEMKE